MLNKEQRKLLLDYLLTVHCPKCGSTQKIISADDGNEPASVEVSAKCTNCQHQYKIETILVNGEWKIMDNLWDKILSSPPLPLSEKTGKDIMQLVALRKILGLQKDTKIPLKKFVTLCNEKGVDVKTCAIMAAHLKNLNELEE